MISFIASVMMRVKSGQLNMAQAEVLIAWADRP